MLTFEQIKELIDQVASHRLSGVELERSGFRLKIDGQKTAGQDAASVHLSMPAMGHSQHHEPSRLAISVPIGSHRSGGDRESVFHRVQGARSSVG